MKLEGYNVTLRQIESQDLERIRSWRNDPQVSQHMLSQEYITQEQQQAWFKKVSGDQGQQHFVIFYKGEAIGCANVQSRGLGTILTNAKTIEPGLYIADERYRGNIVAFAPTLLLNDYCFDTLNANKLLAVVKKTNQAALNYNLKLGYKIESSSDLIEISLNKADYQSHSQALKALLSRPNKGSKG